MRRSSWIPGWSRRMGALAGALSLGGLAFVAVPIAGSAATAATTATAAPTAPPYSCAPNGPTGGQTVYGTFGDASAIGWAGNSQGVVACLGGSFWVDTSGPNGGPGSASTAAVSGTTYGYGVYDDSKTSWTNAGGYLPAMVTSFTRDGAKISITNFGDQVTVGGHSFVIIYSRVAVTNPTGQAITVDPQASAGLIALNSASDTVPAHSTVDHDYAVPSDKFGGSYAYPSSSAIVAAGGYSQHFTHMKSFWDGQLAGIAQITQLPDASLINAYKTGFIYTQIIRSGEELKTGVNGYDQEFSHDVIGILANLFTQGYTTDAHGLLLRARTVSGNQPQYLDGVWTYPWVWAIYLLKTGDKSFVKANFATEGPGGKKDPSIKDTAHTIAADRTGPGGIMEETNDIDANGFWTIDNYEALMGLWSYHWLAQQVGDSSEASWALSQYNSLLAATNKTLNATISANHLNYLPCSMTEPNTSNRCVNAEDANWAAPFLFGRWAWDGYLFGAPLSGPGVSLIDATYQYGFDRLKGALPANTFGGYPTQYYTTAYNAGYGEWGLASNDYRDQGILSYQFMVSNGQAGPYSWWESEQFPNPGSPWTGTHPESGNGSSPHAWGIANANMVLLDSIAAQRSDGSLVVGRGIPSSWLSSGKAISVANFPTTDGKHINLTIRGGGSTVTLQVSGAGATEPVLLQLPALQGNIAHASAGTVDAKAGTVTLPAGTTSVSVQLDHAAS
jgi:hypothetical protein